MDIDKMRHALRNEESPSLSRRRKIVALSAAGIVDFAIISLFQVGIIRHLRDIPGRIFDSDKVNSSHKAYAMGVPDGTTGAALYAANMILASAGGTKETGRHPIFSTLLGGTVAAGAFGAIQYLWDMGRNQQKACPYCITGALLNFAMVPLIWRELREEVLPWLSGERRMESSRYEISTSSVQTSSRMH